MARRRGAGPLGPDRLPGRRPRHRLHAILVVGHRPHRRRPPRCGQGPPNRWPGDHDLIDLMQQTRIPVPASWTGSTRRSSTCMREKRPTRGRTRPASCRPSAGTGSGRPPTSSGPTRPHRCATPRTAPPRSVDRSAACRRARTSIGCRSFLDTLGDEEWLVQVRHRRDPRALSGRVDIVCPAAGRGEALPSRSVPPPRPRKRFYVAPAGDFLARPAPPPAPRLRENATPAYRPRPPVSSRAKFSGARIFFVEDVPMRSAPASIISSARW